MCENKRDNRETRETRLLHVFHQITSKQSQTKVNSIQAQICLHEKELDRLDLLYQKRDTTGKAVTSCGAVFPTGASLRAAASLSRQGRKHCKRLLSKQLHDAIQRHRKASSRVWATSDLLRFLLFYLDEPEIFTVRRVSRLFDQTVKNLL
jgi:hypothetical protein